MIRATACEPAEVLPILRRAASPKTDSLGSYAIGDMIAIGQCFKVTDERGRIVGAYVLQAKGPVLWILAAAGWADFDLTAAIAELVTMQGQQFDSIGFRTERRGLVRKARRHGFEVVVVGNASPGYYMRKRLT